MRSISVLPFGLSLVSAAKLKGHLAKEDIPSSGREWVTLDSGVEFQPGKDFDPRLQNVRKLWASSNRADDPVFIDGTETYYDDYAQAWRLLGFYIDCDHCDGGMNDAECIQEGQEPICQRFLLWAAYVDLDYAGNGIGEYMYYDRNRKKWNSEACRSSGSSRCVRMDCHEPTSHFKLLGIFKEPDYATFLQQLVAYQGDCVWTDEEYAVASTAADSWPQGCTQASNGLYYDVKPETGGSMAIGLYNDAYCVEEYEGDITVGEALGQAADDDSVKKVASTLEDKESWNNAFDAFKICQPCRASNLVTFINDGAEVERNSNGYDDDNGDDEAFTCQNNAYDGFNQCMQFQGATNMYTASYHDLMVAEEQGTVGSIKMAGVKYGESEKEKNNKWKKNLLSVFFMIASFYLFLFSFQRCQNDSNNSDLDKPLVRKSNDHRGNNSRGRNRR